jgi:hypothetical protein
MAKRFRDTKLSREAWYRKLKPAFKCAWDFLCDECDEAGMWSIDMDALAFFIGEEIDFNAFLEAVNADRLENPRLEKYGNDKIWITGFVEFQYGLLSDSCIPHRKIILLLKKYNLSDRVPGRVGARVLGTLQEKKRQEEDKEKEEEKTFGKSENLLPEPPEYPAPPSKPKREPNLKPEKDDQSVLKALYTETIAKVQIMPDSREQKQELANFITDHKPRFIEPYCDLWNLSVKSYGVTQVETISDGRLKKFKTRIREPAFDFLKILSEIKISDYLQGKKNGWKVDWDWIMANDTDYLKIIEGKYRNNTN